MSTGCRQPAAVLAQLAPWLQHPTSCLTSLQSATFTLEVWFSFCWYTQFRKYRYKDRRILKQSKISVATMVINELQMFFSVAYNVYIKHKNISERTGYLKRNIQWTSGVRIWFQMNKLCATIVLESHAISSYPQEQKLSDQSFIFCRHFFYQHN